MTRSQQVEEQWITEKCKEAEAVAIKKDSKTLYNKIKEIIAGPSKKPQVRAIFDNQNNLLTSNQSHWRLLLRILWEPIQLQATVRPISPSKNFSQMAIMKRNHQSYMVKYSEPCIGWRLENHLAHMVFRQNCWRLVEWQFVKPCLISAQKFGTRNSGQNYGLNPL